MMKEQKKMNNKGFSLVELIIVIAIMAILVGVLAPQFIKYVEKSRQSTDMQNIQQYKTAIEAYVADAASPVDVTISIDKSAGEINVDEADSLEGTGLTTSTPLKSSSWGGDASWTYNTSGTDAYKWTGTASGGDGKSDSSDNDLAAIFNL